MTTYADDFNRTNSATSAGTNWTNRNNFVGIDSNTAYPVTNGVYCIASYNSALGSDDMSVSLTLGSLSGSGTDLVITMLGANTTGESVIAVHQTGTGASIIYTVTAWTLAGLTTRATGGTVTLATADVCTFTRVGNVYTMLKNGVSITSWTDSGNVVPRDSSHRLVAIGGIPSTTNYRRIDSFSATDNYIFPKPFVFNTAVRRASFY